jgi:hypothetical protein
MNNSKFSQQLDGVEMAFRTLLGYFMVIVFAMSGYFKLFSNWRAAAVIAPALAMYFYGTRTLKKAIASIKENTK